MTRKLLVLLAFLLTVTTGLAGCGGGGGGQTAGNRGEKGQTDGPVTLKFTRISYNDVRPPSKDLWMWKKYEEKTGIRIEWEEIPGASVSERKNVILGSNNLPYAFYQLGFSNDELIRYGEQGIFVPLEDLIEQHAPNLKKLFQDYPEVKKTLTMPDGHIYSLPYIDSALPYRSIRLYINQTWLDRLGLELPKTTDELREVLLAFKEKDANGNGDPNDEMGWIMPSGTINSMFERQLFGSFGLGNGGLKAAENWIYKDQDGEMKLIFNDPKYKDVLRYLRQLYEDGSLPLLNYSEYEYAKWVSDAANDKVGAFSWGDPAYIGTAGPKNFVGINVLAGPGGDRVVSWMDPMTRGTSSFTITKVNPHPEETIKWVDYFYGEEGSMFGFFGIEGETYNMVDGKPAYIDEIQKYEGGQQLGAFQYVDNVYGGYYPYVEPPADLRSAAKGKTVDEDFKTNSAELEKFLPEEIWPSFVPTPEESKEQSAILTDINKYITEMRVKFITGKANLETDWDNYVGTLDRMGAQKYLEIKKSQYERYQSVK
ncbi:ABC transporter substrate-binding protein [Paenibacillus faecis]|uniref:extracellular solute-binding protein n=1 Tax=Paenibacillus faecis TaxID=862114 RepID=UPI001B2BF9AD|nr:extracellular solute-binding protein [Paenibacillus faecis]GIO88132.1 ABC transporter substrate-binding protein [Paenibacillus faecis]